MHLFQCLPTSLVLSTTNCLYFLIDSHYDFNNIVRYLSECFFLIKYSILHFLPSFFMFLLHIGLFVFIQRHNYRFFIFSTRRTLIPHHVSNYLDLCVVKCMNLILVFYSTPITVFFMDKKIFFFQKGWSLWLQLSASERIDQRSHRVSRRRTHHWMRLQHSGSSAADPRNFLFIYNVIFYTSRVVHII